MGNITGYSNNTFKSPKNIYSKIKREFKSFADVNLIDEQDFPTYTAEVLKKLGNGVFKEEQAVLFVKNKKALLPKNFRQIYAAFKCPLDKRKIVVEQLQRSDVLFNIDTYSILSNLNECTIDTNCVENHLKKIQVKQYVKEGAINYTYADPILLRLSPNVKDQCSDDCLNPFTSGFDEITINNGCLFVNFDDADIYLQYYAIPTNSDGEILIPDINEVEKAIEWYIKYQLLLNFWFVDDVKDVLNKWQKAEEQYEYWMGEARYQTKLPSFNKLVDSIRKQRTINKVAFFAQLDKKR